MCCGFRWNASGIKYLFGLYIEWHLCVLIHEYSPSVTSPYLYLYHINTLGEPLCICVTDEAIVLRKRIPSGILSQKTYVDVLAFLEDNQYTKTEDHSTKAR